MDANLFTPKIHTISYFCKFDDIYGIFSRTNEGVETWVID